MKIQEERLEGRHKKSERRDRDREKEKERETQIVP